MNKRGRPRGVTVPKETLALVCLLKKLKWSNRRIGRLFHRDHTTISDWHRIALEEIGNNISAILIKDERCIKEIISVGNSDDVAYIYSKVHQGPCGGGRWIRPHKQNGDWEN